MWDQIYAVFLSAVPAITAVVGIFVAMIKGMRSNKSNSDDVIAKFEEVRKEIYNTKEYSELKDQLVKVHKENYELKKTINRLLEKVDKLQEEKTPEVEEVK